MPRKMKSHMPRAGALIALVLAASAPVARADVTVRAAKAVTLAFTFLPLDVALKEGLFAKYGVKVELTGFTGDAKMQQAFTAGSLDVGLGGGPAMAFAVKGSPVLAVAAFGGPPADIAVLVKDGGPINTVADLRGKTIASSTVGSLTDWLAHQIPLREGWGPDGVRVVATGAGPAMVSAILTGSVDAGMGAFESGLSLEQKHQGRPLVTMDKFEPNFITHVIFARKAFIDEHPKELEGFLKGFFAAVAYMRAHKPETLAIAAEVSHEDKAVLDKVYDVEMPMLLKDGNFDPAALKAIKQSFLDMKILSAVPSDDQILTRRFVPVKY